LPRHPRRTERRVVHDPEIDGQAHPFAESLAQGVPQCTSLLSASGKDSGTLDKGSGVPTGLLLISLTPD
jgi:hypothetical protein